MILGALLGTLGCAPQAEAPAPPSPPEAPAPQPLVGGWEVPEPALAAAADADARQTAARCFLSGDWDCAETWVEHLVYVEPEQPSAHAAFFGLLTRSEVSPRVPLRELVALSRALSGVVGPDGADGAQLPLCGADCRDLVNAYLATVPPGQANPALALAPSLWSTGGPVPLAWPEPPAPLTRGPAPTGAAWGWSLPSPPESLVVDHGLAVFTLPDAPHPVVAIDVDTGNVRFVRAAATDLARGGLGLPAAPTAVVITDDAVVVGATGGPGVRLHPRTGAVMEEVSAVPEVPVPSSTGRVRTVVGIDQPSVIAGYASP